jgi:predicted PurR-regulated permease PerM
MTLISRTTLQFILDGGTFFRLGLKAFLGPLITGGMCYIAAEIIARCLTRKPWPRYFCRLGLMFIFTLVWLPTQAVASTGNPLYAYEHTARVIGFSYGCETMLAWWAGTLVSLPKRNKAKS